jgi:hypothetical protein
MFDTIKQAEAIVGSLSTPSKMPCYSYSIPAQKCITGAKLRTVENSVCSKCYALKGNYGFPVVKAALFKRFESLKNSLWVEAMVFMIAAKEKSGFFRWLDSGDLQGDWHLSKMVEVAKRLPAIKFWLPTREYKIVADWLKVHGAFPDNLTVRLSAYMLDGEPPIALALRLGCQTSGVSKGAYTCPASKQDNQCGDCRSCWDKSVSNISYKQH